VPRAFFLWPAYWRPEIDLVTIDLDQIKKLKQEKSTVHLLLAFHEFLHRLGTGRRWQEQSGLVLNISNFTFENMKNMFSTKDRNLSRVKENIVKAEIACDNLFLSSHNLVESLNAYQTKVGLEDLLNGQLIDKALGKKLRKEFRADFGKRVERIKYLVLRELARLVSRDKTLAHLVVPKGTVERKLKESEVLIKRFLRKSFTEDKTQIIHDVKTFLDSDIRSFATSILSEEKERLNIYSKLLKLEQTTGSFMLSNYVCVTALDIPLCPKPEDLLFNVPLQYNPKKRFYLLYRKLSKLNENKSLRKLNMVRKFIEEDRKDALSSATTQKLMKLLTEKTGLQTYDHYGLGTPKGIPFCESFIPFRSCIEKAGEGKTRERLFMEGFRKGAELSKAKSLEKAAAALVKLDFFPCLMVTSGKMTRILFSPEFRNDYPWKLWWCLNHLKDQVICGLRIFNPLDLGYFDASDHLYKQVEQAAKLAERFKSVSVPDWLWQRFMQTSKFVGRHLVGERATA